MSLLLVACGALAREVIAIRDKHRWDAHVLAVPTLLHNTPDRIPDAVMNRIQSLPEEYDHTIVIYGDCGTSGKLDQQLDALDIRRVSGPHCYEMYAGEQFDRLMNEEPGTYFLTDYLVQSFDHLVIEGLGLDRYPDLQDMYFGNYRRVVYLQQRDDPELIEKATVAAAFLKLPLMIQPTGYGALESRLLKLIGEFA